MNSRINEETSKLFELWCEISPNGKPGKSGHIIESFPESYKDTQILSDIPEFAFPCKFENKNVHVYSFVLTSSDSKWRFGFCRHDPKSPNAMVIVTYLPWHESFIKFLNVLAVIKRKSQEEFRQILTEAYNKDVPDPGASLKLLYDMGTSNFSFQRPLQFQLPSIFTDHNLKIYYSVAESKLMIAIFASMLAERRIIFTSNHLDRLSACVQAASAFLYPMVWQHIYIPILPMKMKDFLSAPMPFIIGAPEEVLKTVRSEDIGEVVLFDCDKKLFLSPFDDVKDMPNELVSQLKKQLNNPQEHKDDKFSKIFLGILVQLIGNYRDALNFSQGVKITWNRKAFIESRPPNFQQFLENMLQLQIFQQFIEDRLDMLNTGLGFSDEFELETLRYAEKMGKRRPYKKFFRDVKDMTNPAMKSAVKSVREGSKGVKSAYKGFKSILKETPTQRSQSQYVTNDIGHHHSAPNSPVFTKRIQSELYNNKPVVIESPNGDMWNNYTTTTNTTTTATKNSIHINKSPPLSTPSSNSNSSSDMNILQELQQHDLFKSPTVDRSLKPSKSNEYHPKRPPRNGPPTPNIQHNQDVLQQQHQQHQQHQQPPIGTLCLFEKNRAKSHLSSSSSSEQTSSSKSSNSLFDASPSMPSPPPPQELLPKLNVLSQSVSTSLPKTFDNNNFVHKNNDLLFGLDDDFSVVIAKNSNELQRENTVDLIKLETNSSFEVEDFDPLNKNAKPLPLPGSSRNIQNNISSSFNNPIYPYYTPNYTQPPLRDSKDEEDTNLLRKYGLEKFAHTADNGKGRGDTNEKNNWVKFD